MIEIYPPIPVKICYRCGGEFQREGKMCPGCREATTMRRISEAPPSGELTPREKQIVDLVAQGKANKQIAFELGLSYGTVKVYLTTIMRKLKVANRTETALWALRQNKAA